MFDGRADRIIGIGRQPRALTSHNDAASYPRVVSGFLAVAPPAVPAIPMVPVAMAVPIAAAGVKYVYDGNGEHGPTRPGNATAMARWMKSPAAAAVGISR
jgi:hypothetical protein